jgi:hypothetical protein
MIWGENRIVPSLSTYREISLGTGAFANIDTGSTNSDEALTMANPRDD